jgi:ribose transport system permease protein
MTTGVADRTSLVRKTRRLLALRQTVLLAYALALILFGITSAYAPGFAAPAHVRFLLIQASFIGFAALGQTFVILAGGVDLSIPSVISASAVLLTTWAPGSNAHLVWALPIVLAMCALVGAVNGAGIALCGISPIVMTLGMNVVVEGALLVYTRGAAPSQAPPIIVTVTRANVGPLPVEPMFWIAVAVGACVVLGRTSFGRKVYAVGTSEVVALFAGINVARVRLATYVISGIAAGIAGVLLTGYLGQSYLSIGTPYLFTSVAAPAIGGVSAPGAIPVSSPAR